MASNCCECVYFESHSDFENYFCLFIDNRILGDFREKDCEHGINFSDLKDNHYETLELINKKV